MLTLNFDDIFRRFMLMADLNEQEAERYKILCKDATAEIQRKINTNDPKAQGILCAAAAALSLYRWTLISASSECESFSAGDIRVIKNKENVLAAKELWLEASREAAEYLNDSGFVFEEILI